MGSKLEVAVMGLNGRMAKAIRKAISFNPEMILRSEDGRADIDLFQTCDVVIDFTTPESSIIHAKMAEQTKTPIVIGTTGFSLTQDDMILSASRKTTIVKSGNTSAGINLMIEIAKQAKRTLGKDYDISISEKHHKDKKDAPSATALMIRDAINPEGEDISFYRAGDSIGTHQITFFGSDETIIIKHTATNRSLFVKGALQAAKFCMIRPAGLYTMDDVLKS